MTPSNSVNLTPERTPRYQVRGAGSLDVVVRRHQGREPTSIPAKLVDISDDGARLRIFCDLEAKEPVDLQLRTHDPQWSTEIAGSIEWQRPGSGGASVVGCSFASPLPKSAIETLASHGCLDPGTPLRLPIDGDAEIWIELNPKSTAAAFVDLSRSGVCLLSPNPATVGQRVRLHSTHNGENVETIVTVQSCIQFGGGHLLGCALQSDRAYKSLLPLARTPLGFEQGTPIARVRRKSLQIARVVTLLLVSTLIGAFISVGQSQYLVAALCSLAAFLGLGLANRSHSDSMEGSSGLDHLLATRLDERLDEIRNGWTVSVDVDPFIEAHQPVPK